MNTTKILEAARFAARAHGQQVRKGTDTPYIVHPLGVARILAETGASEPIIIAGLLHDTVEDAGVKLKTIRERFGPKIASLVASCSENKSKSWRDRKLHTVETIKAASSDLCLLELADKLDNARAIKSDLAENGETFWQRFNRPKEEQAWYYRSLSEAFRGRTSKGRIVRLVREFAGVVREIFGDEKSGFLSHSCPKERKSSHSLGVLKSQNATGRTISETKRYFLKPLPKDHPIYKTGYLLLKPVSTRSPKKTRPDKPA